MTELGRKTKRYPSDLPDEEWAWIEPLLPKPSRRGRKRKVDLREMLNAIRYLAYTAGGWRKLPVHFSPWQTVYWRFRRFVRRLLFRPIHDVALMLDREATGREASLTGGALEGQTVKAAFAEERGFARQRGDLPAEAPRDRLIDGRLLMVNLTPAQVSDSAGAQTILAHPQALAVAEAPVRRRRPWPHQADGQGCVPRLQGRDCMAIRHCEGLQGHPTTLARGAHLGLDDPVASVGPRLREAPRCVRGHDPRRHRSPPAPARRPPLIVRRTLRRFARCRAGPPAH